VARGPSSKHGRGAVSRRAAMALIKGLSFEPAICMTRANWSAMISSSFSTSGVPGCVHSLFRGTGARLSAGGVTSAFAASEARARGALMRERPIESMTGQQIAIRMRAFYGPLHMFALAFSPSPQKNKTPNRQLRARISDAARNAGRGRDRRPHVSGMRAVQGASLRFGPRTAGNPAYGVQVARRPVWPGGRRTKR